MRNNGGPAFPITAEQHPNGISPEMGMSLRDYFAIHSTQPGITEIAKAAGIGTDGHRVYLRADDEKGLRFDDWWRTKTLEEICDLSAKVRYAQADAMLRVREIP